MADIDMELGSSDRALDLSAHDNDDLIDYDSDVSGAHDQESIQPTYDNPQSSGLQPQDNLDAGALSGPSTTSNSQQKPQGTGGNDITDAGEPEPTDVEGINPQGQGLTLDEDYELYDATPGQDGHTDDDTSTAQISELVPAEIAQDMDAGNETDSIMNNGDDATMALAAEIQQSEQSDEASAGGNTLVEESKTLGIELRSDATENPLLSAETTNVQHDEDINFTADVVDDEITWEENDEERTFSDYNGGTGQGDDGIGNNEDSASDAREGNGADAQEPGSFQHEDPLSVGHADPSSHDEQTGADEAYAAAAQEEEHYGSTVQQEELGHESVDNSDSDFPAITVQYRGDEYPCFSRSSEGFFADASVIEHSVDQLLAGFREELSNEIAPGHELVFQIDELGLEFSESYPRESLSGTTLRQILEIFDLLVKNQDPENSRTLYTYLFTKPSTSKRFEFLMESASAGRGLDEVIYLFESPMPHGPNPVDGHRPAKALEGDQFENGGDESLDNAGEVVDELEELDDLASAIEASREHTDSVEDAVESDGHEGNEALELLEVMENEQALNDDVDETIAEFEADALNNDDPNLINLELGEPFENDNLDVNPDEYPDTSNQPMETVAVETVTIEASTTTTDTADNSTSPVISGDREANVDENQSAQADNDDDDEIDWQEDPAHEGDDALSPQPAAKRGRTDEVLDVEDQQDSKRQRS